MKTAKKVRAKKVLTHNLSLKEYAAQVNLEFGLKKGRKEGVAKGRQEGVAKGRKEGQNQMLALMLKRGSMQDVARLTGFSVQKLKQIKKKAA